MSHITVDLKVIEVLAPMVARASEQPVALIIGGLNLLWHRCWSTKKDTITRIGMAGIFGMANLDTIIAAMVEEGFLEAIGDAWRVKGADKYLRITEARSKGGKAAVGNLKRGTQPGPGVARESAGESAGPAAGDQPEASRGEVPGSAPALTPSTEHRAPSTVDDHHQPPIAAFEIAAPDLEAIESWSKEDFWRAAEVTRRSMGYPPSRWPHPVALSRWWGEARGIADVRELAQAFTKFARDKHWSAETPAAPFGAFMRFWNDHLPKRNT